MRTAIVCALRSNFMFYNKQAGYVNSCQPTLVYHLSLPQPLIIILSPVTLITVIISWPAWLYQLQFDSFPVACKYISR